MTADSMVDPLHQYKKTRIAPTPSGYLHLGNVLSFAITAALAKKHHAGVLLRIDDLDRERADKRYIQDIFDTLNFLAIPWNEGPRDAEEHENTWSQLQRMDNYNKALQVLKENGKVFACTCSRTQIAGCTCRDKNLPLDIKDASWRLNTSSDISLTIKTLDGVVESSLPLSMQNFVVKKKDGFPAYQLTSVVDDLYFGIDLVVRGHDLWDSTLAQHYLSVMLGADAFSDISFHHHPLLMTPGGEKLSKSAGDTSVQYLRAQGNTPADIYTILGDMLGISGKIDSWQQLTQLTGIKLKS